MPRKTRWTGTTADERRAELAKVTEARVIAARRRRIDRLITEAPELTESQKAKLRLLLNGPDSGDSEAAS